MTECWALGRLIYHRNRFILSLVGTILVVGLLTAGLVLPFYRDFAAFLSILSFIPIVVWAYAAMEVDTQADILSGESCYSHWLLRQPLTSWQLALVPNLLRCVIIGGLWVLAATILSIALGRRLPVLIPAVAFSAEAVWIAAVAWRPFRYGLWRLVWLPVFLVGLWAAFMVTLIAAEYGRPIPYRQWILASAPIMLAWGFWVSYRSVVKARVAATGRISAQPNHAWWTAITDRSRWNSLAPGAARRHRGSAMALAWHDLKASQGRLVMMWVISLSIATGLAMFATLPAPVIFAMVAMLAYFASISAQSLIEPASSSGRTLAPYLIASPMRSATIAWTRAMTVSMLCMVMTFSLLIPLGIGLLRPSIRHALIHWEAQCNLTYESPWAAIRIVAAVVIVFLLLVAGRSINALWAAFWGNSRLHGYVGVIGPLWVMAPLLIVPGWFLRQPDWETAIANAWWWAGCLPWAGCGLLVLKLIAVGICLRWLWRSRLESPAVIRRILFAWLACWAIATLGVWGLVPDLRVQWWWCGLLIALTMPLARVLIMPVAVHHDRHR